VSTLLLLTATAAGIGFVHTLVGPDHYLPFIVMARARRWTWRRTAAITLACGSAHVLSSVALAAVGAALGVAVTRLLAIESARGELAAWALVAVGAVYAAWGLSRALRGDRHVHLHPDPVAHSHPHGGDGHDHAATAGAHHHAHHPHHHRHAVAAHAGDGTASLTPWMLFLVFVLGPCEPLIPLMLVSGATGFAGATLVAFAYGAATLAAMLAAVWVGQAGVRLLPLGRLERYTHALAGSAILVSGLGMVFLGW
jgi:ABC-type nickel/cobalt efflux system permease component RcnA